MLFYDCTIEGEKVTLLLGGLTYERRIADTTYLKFQLSYLWSDIFCVYILTFGVINEMRGQGLGSFLLDTLEKEIQKDAQMKYIYLDVVDYNDQGVKCYEKNGYLRIDHREEHYSIFDRMYDSEVYIKYLNGS